MTANYDSILQKVTESTKQILSAYVREYTAERVLMENKLDAIQTYAKLLYDLAVYGQGYESVVAELVLGDGPFDSADIRQKLKDKGAIFPV